MSFNPFNQITKSIGLYSESFPAIGILGGDHNPVGDHELQFLSSMVRPIHEQLAPVVGQQVGETDSGYSSQGVGGLSMIDRLDLNLDNVFKGAPYLRGIAQSLRTARDADVMNNPQKQFELFSGLLQNVQGALGNVPPLLLSSLGHQKPLYMISAPENHNQSIGEVLYAHPYDVPTNPAPF